MKLTLHLSSGGIGLGFDGHAPVVVRKVAETGRYAPLVRSDGTVVVTGVRIPGIVSVRGTAVDAAFVIALLKRHAERDDRVLELDERPLLALSSSSSTSSSHCHPSPGGHDDGTTTFTIHLPTGSLGVTFENAPHTRGPCVVREWEEDSPLALSLIRGLQFQSLEVPETVTLERVFSAERLHEYLDAYADVEGRVLRLQVPSGESEEASLPVPRHVVLDNKGSLCEIVRQQDDAQMAVMRLVAGAATVVRAQPGSLVYLTPTSAFARAPSSPGRRASHPRLAADERIALSTYALLPADARNKKSAGGTLALAPPVGSYRARLFVVHLEEYGGALIVGQRNFLFTADERVLLFAYKPSSSSSSVDTTTTSDPIPDLPRSTSLDAGAGGSGHDNNNIKRSTPGAQLLRGEGSLTFQRVIGKGQVVLTAGGVVQKRTLVSGKEDDAITVATERLVAYTHGMPVRFENVRGWGSVVVWGQGTATLRGPGTVWTESHPSSRGGGAAGWWTDQR